MGWEPKIPVNQVFELRYRTIDYFGVGAVHKIGDILNSLKEKGITSILIVTDSKVYKVTGAWDIIKPALEERGFRYSIYEGVVPNPTTENVEEGRR
ncbi:MAG: alcohol dehydrogenase, partial [Thermoprotei archaeon]